MTPGYLLAPWPVPLWAPWVALDLYRRGLR